MNWIEEILIICGISLDVFAAMACQGALVAKIEKKRLVLLCGLIAAWQVAALFLGDFLAALLRKRVGGYEMVLGEILAAAIFFCLGIRLLIKAWKNERIVEKREEDLNWKRLVFQTAVTAMYTFLTGVAFGFLGVHVVAVLIMVVCISILVVTLGMYTGYRLGFEQKLKAYIAGAALLFIAGVDVVIRYIMV